MRVAIIAAVVLLTACASGGVSTAPPAGVDFSGQWKFNAADSDDPMHLLQIANAQASAAADNAANGGRGGRGGRGGTGYPTLMAPATPPIGAMTQASQFPGKLLEIKQVAGVLSFTSAGQTRVCQPGDIKKRPRHHHDNASDRDAPLPAAREAPPPRCAWSEKTLIVRSSEVDEDRPPYEEHYSISDDGQRLIEAVSFRGGRSSGFVMSRVWDRVPQ
ncbi:MAG TPA: hypothetical protein VN815_10785 [Steroidobacteraceae bacterium]|jgi:hypothetical protein|nr:hypothetical protein [Steroidobacteraceae bacterium]